MHRKKNPQSSCQTRNQRASEMPNHCESGKMDMKSPVRLMVFIGNFKQMLV